MELCTTTTTTTNRAISSFHRHRLLSTPNPTHFRIESSPRLHQSSPSRIIPELRYLTSPLLRSEKRSSGSTQCYGEERDVVITLEDNPSQEKRSTFNDTVPIDVSKDESPMDEQTQGFELLDKLNIQVDSADASSILLFGSGALVSLWFASAIVGAIDAIPVFPKLMEVVGLAYTLWFSTRYLLFKKNRDELVAKIEQIKQQVLGSIED